MSKTHLYTKFFRRAEAAVLAAIELYNKPDFRYREEAFAILILNAWELILIDVVYRLECYRSAIGEC